jgi:hypothetical protein
MFRVPKQWKVWWLYQCSGAETPQSFAITIYTNKHHIAHANPGITRSGPGARHTEHYHHSGQYYLRITSACSWQVKVTRLRESASA